MKKRTKKKIKRKLKKFGLAVLAAPFKGLWWLVKALTRLARKGAKKTKKKVKRAVKQRARPKVEAVSDPFVEIQAKKGKLSSFERKFYTNKSTIGIILGARGTGKSALGMRLLENCKAKTAKKIYAIGFDESSLPSWIKSVSSVEEISNNAVLLIDEGGIEFSSRKSMSNANEVLSEVLLVARHKDLSVIFITQNSANLEINAIRQADYLLLKPSSLLQKDFERKKIKDVYNAAQDDFEELEDIVGLTYVYADNYRGFVSNSLPSFWGEKVSKGWAKR